MRSRRTSHAQGGNPFPGVDITTTTEKTQQAHHESACNGKLTCDWTPHGTTGCAPSNVSDERTRRSHSTDHCHVNNTRDQQRHDPLQHQCACATSKHINTVHSGVITRPGSGQNVGHIRTHTTPYALNNDVRKREHLRQWSTCGFSIE